MNPVLGEIIGWEFLLVIAIIALLFGSTQIPKLAKSLGSAKKEFESGLNEEPDQDDDAKKARRVATLTANCQRPVVVVVGTVGTVCDAILKWFESIASHNKPNSTAAQKKTSNVGPKPRDSDLAIGPRYEHDMRAPTTAVQLAFMVRP
jgi:sec-independent protein translocase protein TatA